jgi:hypothetical protein
LEQGLTAVASTASMAMVAPPPSWAMREPATVLSNAITQSVNSNQVGSNIQSHLSTSMVSENITCTSTTGAILNSRDSLPQSTTPGSQANSSQSTSSQLDKTSNIECVVCGDKSSGKHYGQFTCEVIKFKSKVSKLNWKS